MPVNGDAMQYGMFIMPFHPPSKPLAQAYDEDLELTVLAEEFGFTEFWIGEHHTMRYEPIVMPEIFIARALGVTSRMRLGPAPVCLQQHHPAHVAGRLAFLDHLAKGRINVCLGAGSVTADMELFGIAPEKSPEMVEEAVSIILKLWTTEPPYHYAGKFWNIHLEKTVDEETGIGYMKKPYQLPHPPLAMPGMTSQSLGTRLAGRLGISPIASNLVTGNVIADMFRGYREAAAEAGRVADPAAFRVCRSIFLADTTREAQAKARRNALGQSFEYIGRLFDKGLGRKIYKRDPNQSNADTNLDYLMREQILAGSVNDVLDRLLRLIEETGPFGTLILMGYDWGDEKESWLHSLRLFTHELMPALNRAVPGGLAATATPLSTRG
jgi:alkanesulfonate monooxygenase SsuD/methylene tetrahydromethanopterin reductase-like flavin-dependent oxidoreductase (luciferase family)